MIWQDKWQHQNGRKQIHCRSFKTFGEVLPSQASVLVGKSILPKYDSKQFRSLRDALWNARMYYDSPERNKKNVNIRRLPTEKQGEKVCHVAVPSL